MAGLPQFPISTQTDPYWEIPMYDAAGNPLSIEGRVFEAWIAPAQTKQGVAEPVEEIKVLTFQDGLTLVPPTDGSGDQTVKNTLVHQVSRDFAQKHFPRGELTADLLEVVGNTRRLFSPVRLFYLDPAQIREFVADRAGITFGPGRQPIVTPVAIAGQAGRRGSGLLTGTLPPQPSDGEDGDYWVVERADQANLVYGPKENGEWPPEPSSTFGVGGVADVPGLDDRLQVTVSSMPNVYATAADRVQAALDKSLSVILDGDYDISGHSLRFRSGHRIIGKGDNARLIVAADPAGMSYRLPLLMLEDVRGLLVEGLTIEYTYRSSVPSRQYGALCRASAPGFCGGIIWRNVTFKGAPVHNEPGVEGVIFDNCIMDGKATITNPQPGGIVGVSNGGSRLNLATGVQEPAPGAAKDISFFKCRMFGFRSEAIDCDVAWNVHIRECTIRNWNCDGGDNEAIDIGGVATDGTVCRDIWIEDNTLELTHVDAQSAPVAVPGSGIRVKLGTVGAVVRKNKVRSNTATAGAGAAILFEHDGTTGEITGNETLGFRQGIAVNNTPTSRIPVRSNLCEGMHETGVSCSNGGGVTVADNDIIGLPAGSTLSAIRLLGCTDYFKGENRLSGKFNGQVTFIDANSTGSALPDINRATAAGGPTNVGAASTFTTDMLAALNGLSRAGGAVSGTINHNGAYNLTGTLTSVASASVLSRHTSDANGAQVVARKSRGTVTAQEALSQNDLAGGLFAQGYTGAGYANLMTVLARCIAATPSTTDMQSRLEIALNAAGTTTPTGFLSGDHATGLSLFGQPIVDQNRHIRHRLYTTRASLPTPTASNVGEVRVGDPETGKSPLVYNTGSTWVYVGDNSAVSLA